MKWQFCVIIALFSVFYMNSQDLSGTWKWTSADGSKNFEIELEKESEKEYRGRHCAVFDDGERIDCASDTENFSIVMLQISDGNFAGTIESSYEQSQGKIRMQYYTQEDVLYFNLTKNPLGIFYLPTEAILMR